jgi:uncharacterized protein (DUF1697 family)
MATHVALLRGINVGPHRRVPMADLRAVLTAAGYGDVRTHLQSGNVVLTSDLAASALARAVEQHIATGLGVDVDVVVRTRAELEDVVARNPLGAVATDPRLHQVTFLSGEPDPEAVRALVALDVAPEQVVISGREIHAWHPGGIQGSRLARRLADSRLGVPATARNWNTVTKLLALAGE